MNAEKSSHDYSSSDDEDASKAQQNSSSTPMQQRRSTRVLNKSRGGQSISKQKATGKKSVSDALPTESTEEDVSIISKTRSQIRKKPNHSEIIQPEEIPGLFMIDRNPGASEPAAGSSSSVLRTFPKKGSEFSTKSAKKYYPKCMFFNHYYEILESMKIFNSRPN